MEMVLLGRRPQFAETSSGDGAGHSLEFTEVDNGDGASRGQQFKGDGSGDGAGRGQQFTGDDSDDGTGRGRVDDEPEYPLVRYPRGLEMLYVELRVAAELWPWRWRCLWPWRRCTWPWR
jgi:hypothetical protein